ncbi:MAG: hypothetical protein IKQ91_11380 [Oscillospiraceae bacterium]|nr:hypothetical protein [Oscillospiraceae bacterium]
MKELVFQLSDELAQKFELAVQLTGDNRDALAEEFVRGYLAKALQSAANEFRTPEPQAQQPRIQPQPAQTPPPSPAGQTGPKQTAPPPRPQTVTDFWQSWGKANKRIPRWARNPQQNNHKILRAFFELKRELGNVTIDALRSRCSDPTGHPNTYVPHFDNNFSQMKFDNGNSHGKVFEEHDGYITIWDRISDTLQKYRDYFQ